MMFVKQYGAKRTGTNYIRWLMESNFDVVVLSNILGWKHGLHPKNVDWSGRDWDHNRPKNSKKLVKLVTPALKQCYAAGNIRYSVLVKNPYSYYVSHVRIWPKKGDRKARAKECIVAWNNVYSDWCKLPELSKWVAITRFEDLIKDKKKALNDIALKFGLKQVKKVNDTDRSFRALNEITKGQKKFKRKDKFDVSYYLKKKYMSFISPEILKVINSNLDRTLMDVFSYKLE